MEQLHIHLNEHSYNIYIESGLLSCAGKLIRQVYGGAQAIVLSDETVHSLYGKRLTAALDDAGISSSVFLISPGEASKSMNVLEELLTFMADSGLTRSGLLIAMGGGVVGDLGGFAASCYMRGIDFVQIPTTLLSQVDSSVGGKTAVNLRSGKNLVGTFWQPRLVIADTQLLSTLNDREFAGGMAEVIKYGAIFSDDFFRFLESCESRSQLMERMPYIIRTCCDLKRMVVEEDERDTGRRMLLNFGHTFGHAIETIGSYQRYIHGEGVALGMLLACRYGELFGTTPPQAALRLSQLCRRFGLPVSTDISPQDMAPHMAIDKKADGATLRLVLLHRLGKAYIETVSVKELSTRMQTLSQPLCIDRFPSGQVFLPPSKSIGHRALICAALAGSGTVFRAGQSEDIQATLRCLSALGVALCPADEPGSPSSESGSFRIEGGLSKELSPPPVLDCSESGSTLRFLIPLAALYATPVTFTGSGRLMERPLHVYESCLASCGVSFRRDGSALTVCGPLQPGVFSVPGDVSSQFITGLLFALPLLSSDSAIEVQGTLQSASYVTLTLSVLKDFGIRIETEDLRRFSIPGNQRYAQRSYAVEADFSGAAFFLAAGALGCPVELMGLNPQSVQGDQAFLPLLQQAGFGIAEGPHGGLCVLASGSSSSDSGFRNALPGLRPRPLSVDVSDIPDLVPPLAALLAFADGESRIEGAGRLRIKESDRLATVTRQLNRLGADITEGEDFLIIRGKPSLHGGTCCGENDHRIAMMCAVAAIGCTQPVLLSDSACVKKSYPAFWQDFLRKPQIECNDDTVTNKGDSL